jgi:branched-chain amino acid transport system substrate-binding protein
MRASVLIVAMLLFGARCVVAQSVITPVRIGVLNDGSSVYTDLSGKGSWVAAQLAVQDFAGKVLGRPIEVLYADHQNKPDIGSSVATQWYDRDGVSAIFDVPPSTVALSVQRIANERGKIVIFSGGTSSDLTGKSCSPTGFQWTQNTLTMTTTTVSAAVQNGAKRWFFITADFAYGHALERDATNLVLAKGGTAVGSVVHPPGSTDLLSQLLQAGASDADTIGLANGGSDTINTIKQAAELHLEKRIVPLGLFLNDIHALGLDATKGMVVISPFYWNMNDGSRAFSERFAKEMGRPPEGIQAGVYSAVSQYLKSVAAAGTTDGVAVAAKLHALPVEDFMTNGAQVRQDGWLNRDFYVLKVKNPSESKDEWDLLNFVAKIPGDQAAPPLGRGCSLVVN